MGCAAPILRARGCSDVPIAAVTPPGAERERRDAGSTSRFPEERERACGRRSWGHPQVQRPPFSGRAELVVQPEPLCLAGMTF